MLDEKTCSKIKQILENDGVIAFVTDTVWGLGCLPESRIAVEKIYKIKHRDSKKPLILMSFDTYPLLKYVDNIPKAAHKLMKEHFPGALTLVMNKSKETPDYVTSGMDTVGIRVPDNEVFSDILKYKSFYENSNGGVTISGGEPLLQIPFLKSILKKNNLKTAT